MCDQCLCASCWQGVFMCEKARTAGVVEMRVGELEKLDREHPQYWEKGVDRG